MQSKTNFMRSLPCLVGLWPPSTKSAPAISQSAGHRASMSSYHYAIKYGAVKQLMPTLTLSREECIELRNLGDLFVTETIQQYIELTVERKGVVDKHQWREVRKKDDIRVYSERQSSLLKAKRVKGYLGDNGGASEPLPTLPPFMVVGTVVGDLDDVMFGTTSPTVESMKIKTAYVVDGVPESKVLQQIISPSPNDPFRNLAVKWCVAHPQKVQNLMRPRDYTYIDSTGIAISSTGERIGYRITHSIAFNGFPNYEESHSMVRGSTSICCLYRQKSPDVVECFVRAFFELHGEVVRGLALLAIAGQGTSFSKQVHCAHMKKLAWRLRQHKRYGDERRTAQQNMAHFSVSNSCNVCNRTFASSGASRLLMGPIKKRSCSLCDGVFCSKCSVKKRLYFLGPGNHVVHQDLPFCAPCVTETVRMDAYEIAKDEFVTGHSYNPQAISCATRSSSSKSSVSSSGMLRLPSSVTDPLDELWYEQRW